MTVVLRVIVVLPGHTRVMPRAHPGLCVEEVDLALLRGSLLCKGRKEDTLLKAHTLLTGVM